MYCKLWAKNSYLTWSLLKIHFELIHDAATECFIFCCCDVETASVGICGDELDGHMGSFGS